MNELELKIEKLIKDQILITESDAQDLATLICNFPEIKAIQAQTARATPNEGLAGMESINIEEIQKIWDLNNHLNRLHNRLLELKKENYPQINRRVWGRIYNEIQQLSGMLVTLGLLVEDNNNHPEADYPFCQNNSFT